MKISNCINKLKSNDIQILKNIAGSFMVKGGAMILGFFTMPAYMRYFSDDVTLGIWFTILSVINWVLVFDLGIGNGLRNKLPGVLVNKQYKDAKEYISSAYVSIFLVALIVGVFFCVASIFINWNEVLNVSSDRISEGVLILSVRITFVGILIRFFLGIINSILYAVQLSAVNNFLTFISSLIIFVYVSVAPDMGDEVNLISLSYVHIISSNLPLLIATLIIFWGKLKQAKPHIKYFSVKKSKSILSIGVVLLWLQLVWLVVTSTHSFLITKFVGPDQVVEYQIYYKIFHTVASFFSLAMTPIWSAVTKAQAEKDYKWIRKLSNKLLCCSGIAVVLFLIIGVFLQPIVDMWLGSNSIAVRYDYVIVMSLFSFLYVLHSVSGSISNGLSKFKIQMIFMGIAAVLMIPLSWFFSVITGSWIGVIIASSLAVLPYEIIQPIWNNKYLKIKENV